MLLKISPIPARPTGSVRRVMALAWGAAGHVPPTLSPVLLAPARAIASPHPGTHVRDLRTEEGVWGGDGPRERQELRSNMRSRRPGGVQGLPWQLDMRQLDYSS